MHKAKEVKPEGGRNGGEVILGKEEDLLCPGTSWLMAFAQGQWEL